MDRETRKANLRKLQLPGTGKTQRKTRQGAKSTGTTSSISNFFSTPEKFTKEQPDKEAEPPPNDPAVHKLDIDFDNDKKQKPTTRCQPRASTSAKRTKLDDFVFQQPPEIRIELATETVKPANDDDFDVIPEKKAKRAPRASSKTDTVKSKPAKTSRKKKQTTIKSAFMRNEQLFAEIAAQHCAADNFDIDDVQLAIAISRSEAESKGIIANDDNEVPPDVKEGGEKNAELIRQKLEKYGFRTAEKEDYNAFTKAFMMTKPNRTKKSKWANKFTALTLRDEELQSKKLQQKINELLKQQYRTKPPNPEEKNLPNYQFQSKFLKTRQKEMGDNILQLPDNQKIPHVEYFITELFEISNLKPGHLLKNWGNIQGRDLTPKKSRGPHSEGMTAKLHKIYAELEKYFEDIKNGCFEVLKSDDISTVPVNNEPAVTDYFNPFRGHNSEETIVDSGSSTSSSICKHIKSVLPPVKSLDLMHVSISTTKTDAASINSSQSLEESNSSQRTDVSLPLKKEDPNEHFTPKNNNDGPTGRINNKSACDRIDDLVATPSRSTTANSISKLTKNPQSTANSLDQLQHSNSPLCTNTVTSESKILHKAHSLKVTDRTIDNLPSVRARDIKQFSCTPVRAENSINSSQKTRSNSPDLFADSDAEMEEENDKMDEDMEEVIDIGINKSSNSQNDEVEMITTYEIYSSDEVKKTLSSEPYESQLLKEKLSTSQSKDIENFMDRTQAIAEGAAGESFGPDSVLNQSKPIVEVDLFADSPINEEDFEFTPDINSNSETSKYLRDKPEETFKLSLTFNGANATNKSENGTFNDSLNSRDANKTNDNSLRFTLSPEMADNDVFFTDLPDKEIPNEFSTEPWHNKDTKSESKDMMEHSPETFVISDEIKSNDESEKCRKSSTCELEISSTMAKSLEQEEDSLDIEILREHKFSQEEEDEDIVLREIEMNQTNTSFLNFQGSKQMQTCFHRETATEPKSLSSTELEKIDEDSLDIEIVREYVFNPKKDDDIVVVHEFNQTKNTSFLNVEGTTRFQKPISAGNDTIFRELYDKYLGGTTEQQPLKSNDSILRKSFSQILPKVVTPFEITNNETNFNMDLDLTITNHKSSDRKSLSFNSSKNIDRSPTTNIGLSKSQSFTMMHNVSIDLTQTEDDDYNAVTAGIAEEDENDDDDCLVLSDDEINYSIWKAKKTEKFNDSAAGNSESEEDNTKSSSHSKILKSSQHSYSDFELKSPKTSNFKNNKLDRSKFGIMEEFSEPIDFTSALSTPTKILKEASEEDNTNESEEENTNEGIISKTKSSSHSKLLKSSQHSYSDFELKSPKTSNFENNKLDRSKFGIMEEFSEPIDFTASLSTPTKILKEASFLQSPSENADQMKRFSIGNRSAQKFKDLLDIIDNKKDDDDPPHLDVDEYDEFDLMIYQNELTKNTSAVLSSKSSALPQGFDQLMTAEISFKESQKSYSHSQSSSVEILEQKQRNKKVLTKTKSLNELKSNRINHDIHPTTTTTTVGQPLKINDEQELTINNKTYKIRSCNNPKPDYSSYTEAELLKELYNYGIKPLKRKQAVKMLEYIYLQTHPIIVDKPVEVIEVDDNDDDLLPKPSTPKCTIKTKSTISNLMDAAVSGDLGCSEDNVEKKLNLQDGFGVDMLRYSLDLKAELEDEQYILQTNVTKKTQQPLMPFHIAWYNLVCSNRKLHESILMYEPIDLQAIYLFLKGMGYRYDPKDLKQFFDRRCIIFRYDLATAGSSNNGNKVKENKNRHVRKKKKASGSSTKTNK